MNSTTKGALAAKGTFFPLRWEKQYAKSGLLIFPEVPVNTTDNNNSENSESKRRDERGASLEKYLLMNEHEKDIEIQKAVTRLQKRIQEILYLLETEKPNARQSEPDKKD